MHLGPKAMGKIVPGMSTIFRAAAATPTLSAVEVSRKPNPGLCGLIASAQTLAYCPAFQSRLKTLQSINSFPNVAGWLFDCIDFPTWLQAPWGPGRHLFSWRYSLRSQPCSHKESVARQHLVRLLVRKCVVYWVWGFALCKQKPVWFSTLLLVISFSFSSLFLLYSPPC